MATLSVKDFPDDVYAEIRALARREHRSIAQQVVHLLQRATRAEGAHSILELRGLGREAWADADAARHVASERDSWD